MLDRPALPAGYRARPARLDDAEQVRELMAALGRASIGTDDTTLDEVMSYLAGPRTDLELDGLLVLDEQDQTVAWGSAFDNHDERGNVDVYVHPDVSDDEFEPIARRLVDHGVRRLVTLGVARDRDVVEIDAGAYRGERLQRIYAEAGFRHVRVYLRMNIDLDRLSHDDPTPPAGVTIRHLDPTTDDDLRLAQEMRDDVMKGEFGHLPMTLEQFRDSWFSAAGFDPTAWWVAESDTEPLGMLLANDSRRDDDAGYVRTLGVKESARGRGIARALLLTSFAEYARRGRAHVMLVVDSQNEAGATKLYESVGMRPVVTYDSWLLTLALKGDDATLSRNASTSA